MVDIWAPISVYHIQNNVNGISSLPYLKYDHLNVIRWPNKCHHRPIKIEPFFY